MENLRFLLQRASLHSSINTGDLRTRNQKTGTGIICCLQRTSKAAENKACSVVLQLFFQRNATKSKLGCIECFHMTSRRPYWCPKTMKRRPCWCPKLILWELNSFLTQTHSFVPMNLHRCWPREWKHSIDCI